MPSGSDDADPSNVVAAPAAPAVTVNEATGACDGETATPEFVVADVGLGWFPRRLTVPPAAIAQSPTFAFWPM